MGTDLIVIANHEMNFHNPEKQYQQLLNILNRLELDTDLIYKTHIESVKNRNEPFEHISKNPVAWRVDEYAFEDPPNDWIGFDFVTNYRFLDARFCQHTLELGTPYRYHIFDVLSEPENLAHFKRWREVWIKLARAFGGNRMIYLADNAHTLDGYIELHWQNKPISAIEEALFKALGPPVKTVFELRYDQPVYFIDNLQPL
ncbi:MAG: hypothetical protein QY309_00195 [Cyclobacteriaceae bacterium]|nr:MAG: hypothetical protein QY309_00195 [Cyclobacteriaceae bacterium]